MNKTAARTARRLSNDLAETRDFRATKNRAKSRKATKRAANKASRRAGKVFW
jgi:hypothetical protein